jgi:hypothetical protein
LVILIGGYEIGKRMAEMETVLPARKRILD